MSEIKIKAETRTEFGKGAARRIRRDNKVPAVLYGHGIDPIHVMLPGHDLMLALKQPNALLSVDVDGDAQLVLPKQVQRDPIKGFIEHADLLVVRKGEKVTVDIPIVVTGESVSGSMVVTENSSVPIEAEATHLPEQIEVSVEGLDAGAQIHASDLDLAKGSSLAVDGDLLIVNIVAEPTAAQVEAELEEAEAEAGIERDESQAEAAEAAEAEQTEAAPAE
ncbi:50S ribosomal protein L25/general stress protein Ctc [Mumia sp. zg.B17]|uniref:50S ribosomal protein L25/general stress protein Ctc n=1 Tax=unclassified Mumia TaxID=2621872 RepID=UPI001C6EEC89|nr:MULTISPECIES: 50S ribosomal protein L25/general stress protein Ctc [unclassified Mumia]MBW9206915.1 50S ribosomal protein L25/general stress protein Ctc [Mumia sp. zg.B17]MBW9210751.1 50S ribosomal protein L25/general stress protein Ctc [Mumia sp. zg.B21]MDD9348375.1 50S ribosomal protein L25/general stress protein Ctc [Mumia sp.]